MARRTSTSTPRTQPSETVRGWDMPSDERERMIREAAYYRYVRRGYSDGQDLDDWLAAEAALFAGEWELAVDKQGRELPTVEDEPEIQQQSARSPRKDDAVKRAIRKSPRRAIPQIEGIDPAEAPARE